MGLDIIHMKVSQVETDSTQMFLKNEIELGIKDQNYLLENAYSEKLVDGFWEFVAVFKNEEELKEVESELKDLNDGYRYFKLIVSKTDDRYREKIRDFEKDNRIKEFNKTLEIIDIRLKDGRKIQFESICYEGKLKHKVVYFEEAGYQRKGMGSGFSEHYKNGGFYCEKENFKKLLDFNSPKNHMYEEGNIQNNFIQNYSKGESILMISW